MGSQIIPPLPPGFKLDSEIPPLPPGFTLDEPETATLPPRKAGEPGITATRPSFLEEFNVAGLPVGRMALGTPGDRTLLGRAIYGQEATPQAPDFERGLNLPMVKLEEAVPGGTPVGEFARGVLSSGSELTTPENARLMAGVAGLGGLGSPAARAISAYFGFDMTKALYEQGGEFKKAVDAGDINRASNIGGQMLATGTFAGLATKHALTRKPPVAAKPTIEIPPLPEGFTLDKPKDFASELAKAEQASRVTVDDILQIIREREQQHGQPAIEPTAGRRPGTEPGVAPGDQGLLQQPAQPEIDPIKAEAIDLANSLAERYGGKGGIPSKERELIFKEYDERGVGVGGGTRQYVGENINDIPILQDIPHGKEAIERALEKRSGKIWDEIVAGAESAVRRWKEEEARSETDVSDVPVLDTSFDFSLEEAKPAEQVPVSIADFSAQLAKAGEKSRAEAANELVGKLGMKAAGPPKSAGSLEGSPLFPKEPEPSLFEHAYTGGPEAGSLPVFFEPEQMGLPKYAGSINLERVGADYPVKKLIRDVYDEFKGKINERRRGVITHEETKALADDLGMTESQLLKRRLGKAFNAEEVTAARAILNASAQRLNLLREQWAKSGSEQAVAEFRKALELHGAIQAEVSGISTEAGRALSAHRIISDPAKGYKKMLDALGGRELNEEILKQFGKIDAGNAKEVNAFVQHFAKVTGWDKFFEAWRANILSGPKTHIVNATSNLLTLLTRVPETLASAGTETALSTLQRRQRERFFGEVKPEAFGALAGIKDGARAALAAWREELPTEAESMLEVPRHAIPGKAGKAIRLPYRALAAADEMFKAINYSAEAHKLAYRKAKLEGNHKDAAAIARHLSDKDIVEKAQESARYRTFNNPLGPWASQVNRLRQTVPGLKYIVPFIRTPINVAKFTAERTPLSFPYFLREIKRGNLKNAEAAEAMAKPILGSAIGAAVTMLAAEGLITGSGPKNKNERETLLRSGWQPYSLKIGDRYYSYGRLEPVGSILGLAADFVELQGLEKGKDIPQKITGSIARNLTSKTFLQGISDTFDVFSDPQRFGERFVGGFAGSLVPNVVGSVAQAADPYQRITKSPIEAMQVKVPGLSQKLPIRRDVMGREILKPGRNAVERALSPFPVKPISKDFVDQELVRLKAWIGDLDKGTMTNEEFENYAKLVGQMLKPRLEVILRSSLDEETKRARIKTTTIQTRLQARQRLGLTKKKAS